jgi:hypothetical protein
MTNNNYYVSAEKQRFSEALNVAGFNLESDLEAIRARREERKAVEVALISLQFSEMKSECAARENRTKQSYDNAMQIANNAHRAAIAAADQALAAATAIADRDLNTDTDEDLRLRSIVEIGQLHLEKSAKEVVDKESESEITARKLTFTEESLRIRELDRQHHYRSKANAVAIPAAMKRPAKENDDSDSEDCHRPIDFINVKTPQTKVKKYRNRRICVDESDSAGETTDVDEDHRPIKNTR